MEDTLNNTTNTAPQNSNIINANNVVNVPTQSPVTPTPAPTPSLASVQEAPSMAEEDLDMRWTRRKCLVCGYTYEGSHTLAKCPKCGNENPDKFDDAD